MAKIPEIVLHDRQSSSFIELPLVQSISIGISRKTHPVSYPNRRPPVATNRPIMMAGADEPATLSGLCQAMAIAMVGRGELSGQCKSMVVEVVDVGFEGSVR